MFEQAEHEALMRLMTHALGHVDDSKRIAHWLLEWEQGHGIAYSGERDRSFRGS